MYLRRRYHLLGGRLGYDLAARWRRMPTISTKKMIRFNTNGAAATRIDAVTGRRVRLADEHGETTELFDEVVVCTGQFSRPKTLDLPGADTFGGSIVHSSAFVDDSVAKDFDILALKTAAE